MRPVRVLSTALGLALAALAGPAEALEPRFDHRDTHGVFAEMLAAYATVARSGEPSVSAWRPALRAGWGFDLTGDGDELLVAAAAALRWPDDGDGMDVLFAADARYRGYFGTEELKTFFDVGVWVPVHERLAIGPLIGVGLQWDFGRGGGLYAATSLATAFGEARIASLQISAGAQLRFDLP
ncbi:MAG TPA: hypothetical protein VFL83_17795 [Anaeromyxobacter sp.]|nr:hypothetical protein [Anaeromyxobacter sp.]